MGNPCISATSGYQIHPMVSCTPSAQQIQSPISAVNHMPLSYPPATQGKKNKSDPGTLLEVWDGTGNDGPNSRPGHQQLQKRKHCMGERQRRLRFKEQFQQLGDLLEPGDRLHVLEMAICEIKRLRTLNDSLKTQQQFKERLNTVATQVSPGEETESVIMKLLETAVSSGSALFTVPNASGSNATPVDAARASAVEGLSSVEQPTTPANEAAAMATATTA